jgi:formylglycine-generating enzyme
MNTNISFLRKSVILLMIFFSMKLFSQITNMVFIPQGSYIPLFKSSDMKIIEVEVNSFYIDVYPVTNYQFKEFLKKNPSWNSINIKNIFADSGYLWHWNDENINFDVIGNNPIVNISWYAASAYCEYLGKRLPTIDEWEYVGLASKNNPIGKNEKDYLNDMLEWYINTQSKDLVSVNDMVSNFFKVYGMHGYIWEWVQDFNSVILINTDSEGGGLEEVLYCGATATNSIDPVDYVAFMRFAFRDSLEANYTMNRLGFRCVKDIE